jgi:hypothetical protein
LAEGRIVADFDLGCFISTPFDERSPVFCSAAPDKAVRLLALGTVSTLFVNDAGNQKHFAAYGTSESGIVSLPISVKRIFPSS